MNYSSEKPGIVNFAKSLKTSSMKDPGQMITLGKTLIFTGISSLALSQLLFLGGVLSLYYSVMQAGGLLYINENLLNKLKFINSLLFSPNLNVSGPAIAVIALFSLSGLFFLLSILIIPGIVFWAVGAQVQEIKVYQIKRVR